MTTQDQPTVNDEDGQKIMNDTTTNSDNMVDQTNGATKRYLAECGTLQPVNNISTEEDRPNPFAVLIDNHKGFSVRRSKKGFLAFKGGRNLETRQTVEEAIASIDEYLERERQVEVARAEQAERQAKLEAETAERARKKLKAVLACIQPIRDFTERQGLKMLQDCLEQLEQEERDRNVPSNWEKLVEMADQIAEKRSSDDGWRTEVGEVDVDKYGVTEHSYYNSDLDGYALHTEYGLQEYIDQFREGWLPEDEEEE
jgi:hypothetical protein